MSVTATDQYAQLYVSLVIQSLAVTFDDGRFSGLVAAATQRDAAQVRTAVERVRADLGALLNLTRGIDVTTRETRDDLRETRTEVSQIHELVRSLETQTGQADGRHEWQPPAPPTPETTPIGREQDVERLLPLLQAPTGGPVVLHGPSGIGKTLLAQYVAQQIDQQAREAQPDDPRARTFCGVLFQSIGRDGPTGGEALIFRTWAENALGHEPPADLILDAPTVKRLLGQRGRWLVVLDDLWAWSGADPLLQALSNDSRVLVTTQNADLSRVRGRGHPLGLLEEDDAVKLLRDRAPRARDEDEPLLRRLARILELHTLALHIAGGSLQHQSRERWSTTVAAIKRDVRAGFAFGSLAQPGGEQHRDSRVEASLKAAYDDLSETDRRRFGMLGAFAPAATFGTVLAVATWGCEDVEDAFKSLDELASRGLLSRQDENDPTRWQQHAVMRWYALALLRQDGSLDDAARRHALACRDLLAAVEQREHLALSEYAQITHAFLWAVGHA